MPADLPTEFRFELGIAWVTLFKKMRPFSRRGVSLRLFGEVMGGGAGTCKPFCFLRIELFFPPRLLFWGGGTASLQQSMIFSKRNTWYSRSTSDLVTVNISSRRRVPKLDKWWPFQSCTRPSRFLTVWTFSARLCASLILSVMRLAAADPACSSSNCG